MTPEDLARFVIDERLRDHPQTRYLYLTDSTFQAAVEPARVALAAVARALKSRGLGHLSLGVLGDAAADLLDDQKLAAQQRQDDFARRTAELATRVSPVRISNPPWGPPA